MSAGVHGLAQGSLFGGEAWVSPEEAPAVVEVEAEAGVGQGRLVDPYSFVLSDSESRWTVTVQSEEGKRRGKTERALVGRCTCGWTVPSVSRYSPGAGFDALFEHLRDHVLSAAAPVIRVEETRDGWSSVRLAGGRVHCAAECALVTKTNPGPPERPVACGEHGGSLHSRTYHWARTDPEADGYFIEASLLRGPDGTLWHLWCAPMEGRHLFGFVRENEQGAPS